MKNIGKWEDLGVWDADTRYGAIRKNGKVYLIGASINAFYCDAILVEHAAPVINGPFVSFEPLEAFAEDCKHKLVARLVCNYEVDDIDISRFEGLSVEDIIARGDDFFYDYSDAFRIVDYEIQEPRKNRTS